MPRTSTRTVCISLDTRHAVGRGQRAPGEAFRMKLPQTYERVVAMRVASLEIPSTAYTVARGGQRAPSSAVSFAVVTPDGTDVLVEVPEGNHTDAGLVAALNAAILARSLPVEARLDAAAGRVTLASTGPEAFALRFAESGAYSAVSATGRDTLGRVLGFREESYEPSTEHVAEGAVDAAGWRQHYLLLCVRGPNERYGAMEHVADDAGGGQPCMAKVVLDSGRGCVVFDGASGAVHRFARFEPSKKVGPWVEVGLRDPFWRGVDLRDVHYSLTLELVVDETGAAVRG